MSEGYEEFTESQIKILSRYVTSTSSNIFALHNLPEVIKGALFSRQLPFGRDWQLSQNQRYEQPRPFFE